MSRGLEICPSLMIVIGTLEAPPPSSEDFQAKVWNFFWLGMLHHEAVFDTVSGCSSCRLLNLTFEEVEGSSLCRVPACFGAMHEHHSWLSGAASPLHMDRAFSFSCSSTCM